MLETLAAASPVTARMLGTLVDSQSKAVRSPISHFPWSQSEFERFLLDKQKSSQLVPLGGFAGILYIKCPHKPCKDQSHFCMGQVLAHAASWSCAEWLQSMSLIISERRAFVHGLRQPAFREKGNGLVEAFGVSKECPAVQGDACL